MAKAKLKDDQEPMGVYHAAPRSHSRQENDLLDLIGGAVDDRTAESHRRRLMALRARKRAKVRVPPSHDGSIINRAKLPRRDPIAKLGDRCFRIAEMLRDHSEGSSIGSMGELIGFTDGSKSKTSLTQPEAFANGSRRGRIAWERFIEGCGADEVAQECCKIILQRKAWGQACKSLSWGNGGVQIEKLKSILCTGLDEAGAYLGVN